MNAKEIQEAIDLDKLKNEAIKRNICPNCGGTLFEMTFNYRTGEKFKRCLKCGRGWR
jgi:RNase P subunit RPR2